MPVDWYKAVGLDRTVPEDGLCKRLRDAMRQAHGDLRRTAAVNQASRVLRLRPVRALYDASVAGTAGSTASTPETPEAFFEFQCIAAADSDTIPVQASRVIDLTAPSPATTASTDTAATSPAPTTSGDTGDPGTTVLDPSTFRAPAAVLGVRPNALAKYSVLSADMRQRLQDELPGGLVNWALGATLGMVIGDAFGTPLHNTPVRDLGTEVAHLRMVGNPKLGLKPGQWSFVGATALCLLDTYLVRGTFHALDFKVRLFNWWHFGYNNPFGYDSEPATDGSSTGLEVEVEAAFAEMLGGPAAAPIPGHPPRMMGALPRVVAVAVANAQDPSKALKEAPAQSWVTHKSATAAELSQLLCHLLLKAKDLTSNDHAGELLHRIEFSAVCAGVPELCASEGAWQWKQPPSLALPKEPAGVAPADRFPLHAMQMALHCIWGTATFRDAVIMALNLGGPTCVVTAIVGQLAGAIYGLSGIPEDWLQAVQQWDRGGSIALRTAFLLQQTWRPSYPV
mmetsp:Transcript_113544/g.197228  ORF Transcript_113544/g.197228 Transcript_113544/m.197228 type:complete len:509 (-) Transcript_113544:16-1542(-)